MLKRKIETVIEEYLLSDSNKILIVDGARQIGKSFIIRHIGKKLFKNFIELNMYEDKFKEKRFSNIKNVDDFYFKLSTIAGADMGEKSDTLVFIDEIQTYPHLLTLLKFLKADNKYTYIVSGSLLGISLRQTLSIPGGSILVRHMYPLDFEEFLWANGFGQLAVSNLRQCFMSDVPLPCDMHNLVMDLLKKYLLVGGLPDAVNTYLSSKNIVKVREIHDEIINLYKGDASQYDADNALKIKRIYELIPSNMENRKKRVQINDIEPTKGKHTSRQYTEEFEYLISSGVALGVQSISNPKFPLIESTTKNLIKLYLNDVGLLTNILYKYNIQPIMEDMSSINLGSVYESFVASELKAHQYSLYYYDNKSKGEVDFLIDDYDTTSVVPIEVKSGRDYTIHRALNKFISNKEYNIKRAYVLSNDINVCVEGCITYIPVYYAMFLNPSTPKQVILS